MPEPSGTWSVEAEVLPPDGTPGVNGLSSAPDRRHRPPEELLAELHRALGRAGCDWRRVVLETIGEWPLANEEVGGQQCVYLLAGEAFDWRLLAERLIEGAEFAPPIDAWQDWITSPDLFAGHGEAEFRRLLGVDKYRGMLSYFYGVTVEQALLAAAEEEITKRRVASGREPTESSREEAYERLYGGRHEPLWNEFREEQSVEPARPGRRHRDEHSLADSDAFTYWLFKRRMDRSDPARVASDTRKGLAQLERMRVGHERRLRLIGGD